jgi:predicted N-acetyltransferase YhbS
VPAKRIIIDHPRNAKERLALAKFDACGFGSGCNHDVERDLREIERAPGTRPEFHRFARVDGQVVARVKVVEQITRIGRARFRMGGLGDIQTDPAHRGRGYASACINDTIDFMRGDGFDVSFLFGISDFYHRFGYVGCLPDYVLRLKVRDLEGLNIPFTVEAPSGRPKARLLTEVARLYEAAAEGTPATVVRDRMRVSRGLVVFREKRAARRVRAYIVQRKGSLVEAGLAPGDDAAAGAILAWLRDRCIERLDAKLTLEDIPPAHPLARFARRFNHAFKRELTWNGNGMGRLIDTRSFLDKITPELEARLSSAGIDDECRLHFTLTPDSGAKRTRKADEQSLILGGGHHFAMARRGVMSAKVTCSEGALIQMALGTLAYDAIPGVEVSGDKALVRAVFPEAAPAIWPLDHF